ncbi:MAG: ribonuclease HII [Bacteroidetes bacterium]|jgi:ribonuclease HII|nr:ribonuclease HII [Bacteroidota bacterium]MDA0972875.1 ribonuclease HII [Bacteroidota bacterium]
MKRLRAYQDSKLIEAGVDEVGRGCLAGPVVAAAVILPKRYHHPLLDDSKKLSLKTKAILDAHIKENALGYAIAWADPLEIDEINILQASFLAMHRALDTLNVRPEHILVDGNRFNPYYEVPHTCHIKGDGKFRSIAAASVLAKVFRDEWMCRLHEEHPQFAWNRNMGYPTEQHREALEQHGPSPYHRMSFQWKASTAEL